MILSINDVEYYKRCRDIKGRLEEISKTNCPEDIWYDKEQDVWVSIGKNPCEDCNRDKKCADGDNSWDSENMNLLVIKTEDLL